MPRGKSPVVDPAPTEEDRSLIEDAERIFAGEIETTTEEPDFSSLEIPEHDFSDSEPSKFGRPQIEQMIRVRGGGLYLPVRRRVVWMRGEPQQHPDWTIETVAEVVKEGVFKNNKVEAGYARYRANVFDETGRLIATGTKTEYSERFLDFVEKAETGAIGRALAVAGYGTEAAVDLDEGLDQGRIADAPVDVSGRPITINASNLPGAQVGGRNTNVTEPQLREIARLSRTLGLGIGMATLLSEKFDIDIPTSTDKTEQNNHILAGLRTLTFDQASTLIGELSAGLATKQKE